MSYGMARFSRRWAMMTMTTATTATTTVILRWRWQWWRWLVTAFSVTNKWKSQNQMCTLDVCVSACMCAAAALAMNPTTMSMVKSADIYIGLQTTSCRSKAKQSVALVERLFLSSSSFSMSVCVGVWVRLYHLVIVMALYFKWYGCTGRAINKKERDERSHTPTAQKEINETKKHTRNLLYGL